MNLYTRSGETFSGRVGDGAIHEGGQQSVRDGGLAYQFTVMGCGRGVTARSCRIVEIPQSHKPWFAATKLLEHVFPELFGGPLNFPDAELGQLACHRRRARVNVPPDPVGLTMLEGSKAAGVSVGGHQDSVQEETHAFGPGCKGDVEPFVVAKYVWCRDVLPLRPRWDYMRGEIRSRPTRVSTGRRYPHFRIKSAEVKEIAPRVQGIPFDPPLDGRFGQFVEDVRLQFQIVLAVELQNGSGCGQRAGGIAIWFGFRTSDFGFLSQSLTSTATGFFWLDQFNNQGNMRRFCIERRGPAPQMDHGHNFPDIGALREASNWDTQLPAAEVISAGSNQIHR